MSLELNFIKNEDKYVYKYIKEQINNLKNLQKLQNNKELKREIDINYKLLKCKYDLKKKHNKNCNCSICIMLENI